MILSRQTAAPAARIVIVLVRYTDDNFGLLPGGEVVLQTDLAVLLARYGFPVAGAVALALSLRHFDCRGGGGVVCVKEACMILVFSS